MFDYDQLRPWQQEAYKKALRWLIEKKESRQFIINVAPGAGKTICASFIVARLIEMREIERVIIIAPRKEVVNQWAEEFQSVTDRSIMKITAASDDIVTVGVDLCATWSAVQGLLDVFQKICNEQKTLIICDEHHHAAVEAAWGRGAKGAFREAKYVLILTGTPMRSDGQETTWCAHDDNGVIDHPEEGTYTLNYGKAVDLGYCRPITFHRHEGKFTVTWKDGEHIAVSGVDKLEIDSRLKKNPALQKAVDYYTLARIPKYLPDGKTPDPNSYQATMFHWAIEKLDKLRNYMPNAGGLIIAPSIEVAEYMAELLEIIEGEKPIIVHSNTSNPEERIKIFRNSDKKWIVTVNMVSEGVDIKRLRVLVYLPNAQTELHFRQAMGRVVRTMGQDDLTRAYVIMPTHKIFEEFAIRVEREMKSYHRKDNLIDRSSKKCPTCGAECHIKDKECQECGYQFPDRKQNFKTCPDCGALNIPTAKECAECGALFDPDFVLTLEEALRYGTIVRGTNIDEEETQEGEKIYPSIREEILISGDENLIEVLKQLPEESLGRLKNILK